MKKFAAALLAACLALGPCAEPLIPVYGAAQTDGRAQQAQTGILEVTSFSSLLYPYAGKVTVKVSGGGSVSREQELQFTDGTSAKARFEVPAGTYTLTVQAEKFADYVQTVQIQEGWTHKITINPVRHTSGSAQAGWMRAGDIDGDGDVDEADSKALLAAVRENQTADRYDLNGDGKVDLADLDILVQSMDEEQLSTVETVCYSQSVQTTDNTLMDGGAGDFLQGTGGITLKPKYGGAISQSNPVEFTLTLPGGEKGSLLGGFVIQTAAVVDDNGNETGQIASGVVDIVSVDGNGVETTQSISFGTDQRSLTAALKKSAASVKIESDGSIVVDFGSQIAVKRVTIRITGTTKNQPLVEIAKVEFVNNMEDRIPEPQLDIPAITAVTPGNMRLTVSWSAQNNVTGYEVFVSGPINEQNTLGSQVIRAVGTQCDISSINNSKLINYKEYTVKVRSVNGTWKSPWSEAGTGTPIPQGKPAAPDNVRAQGGYRSITVSWKDMNDAGGYMVYYKETAGGSFQPVVSGFVQQQSGMGRLTANSYTISGLKDYTSYSVYVVSWNESGWGNASLTAQAMTKSDALPQLPKYKLLNTSNGTGRLTSHIKSASYGGSGGAGMNASPLDTGKSALGLVDDDYGSYWYKDDWDDGCSYPAKDKGMEVTFDNDYKMNYFTFTAVDQKVGYDLVRIEYSNNSGASAKTVGARLIEKTDANDHPYYIVKFDETVTANKIRMCLGRSWGNRTQMRVGEIHFHNYDSLEDDIMALYTDEMHTTLRGDVTEAVIRGLETRLDSIDAQSGEKHPLYKELGIELQTARDILNSNLAPSYAVHSQITAQKDKHLGFGGLNAWQPLGRTAYAGESLLVFVGHNTKRTGDSAQLQLVYTQHHAEAANVSRSINLKVGKNILTVPQLSTTDVERGGQLYIAYTGNSEGDKYAVRIGGGSQIPVLDVYGKTGSARTQAIREYIQQLESHQSAIASGHEKVHKGNKHVDYTYDAKNCILNATDILMEKMMYSLPATQILAGLGSAKGLDAKVTKLDNALKAMDDMMTLFYQHKGLNNSAGTVRGNNSLPSQHLNIRYMRMFAGAFMYAAGNHIGIEWGSATLASSPGSMKGFGWGIAHEIGHNINQGTYAVAEITNNYFAQLLKKVSDGTTRFSYENVYKKVASQTTGRANNVFTQLAMYWQLHLAFDNSKDDGRVYDDYEQQFANLFFARVDTYSRNPAQAPQKGLTLNGDTDNNLMRLSCAAANANMLPFFERWGMTPDAATKEYAAKYGEPVKKAYYYVNDAARDYRIDHGAEETSTAITARDDIIGTPKLEKIDTGSGKERSQQVSITIPLQPSVNKDVILGYEITRTIISGGKSQSEVVGFKEINPNGDTVFIDTITTINNRVMSYEIKAVDKFLNYAKGKAAGSVKIQTDGELDKSNWTIETTMVSADDKLLGVEGDSSDPDGDAFPDSGYDASNPAGVAQARESSIMRIIDNDTASDQGIYREEAKDAPAEAVITIDMHKQESVTALKYMGSALSSLTVEVSTDGQKWTTVRSNYGGIDAAADTTAKTIWFDAVKPEAKDYWIGTYDARYVRLTLAKSGNISIREIEICGPTGDNLEFFTESDGRPAAGILKESWKYGEASGDVVKAGSLVFTGTYKGNPAYNMLILYDQKGNVIGSYNNEVKSIQVILADVPAEGKLGDTSEGTWVYCVEPEYFDENSLKQITGVRGELYRVDDAKTLEGERIVSDTLEIKMPETLPQITLTGSGQKSGS